MKRSVRKFLIDLKEFLSSSRISLLIFIEVILGLVFSFTSLAVFIEFSTNVFQKETFIFDNKVSLFIYSLRTPLLTEFMIFITNLGGANLLFPTALVIIFLIWRKHKNEALLFSLVSFMGFALNNLLKLLTQRIRPLISPLINQSTYSFPSGHAMNNFIFYALLSFFVFRFTRQKKMSIITVCISLVMVLLIGLSRIYLGVHYPTDVIAGYIAGFWVFVTALLIEKTISFLDIFKEKK